MRTPEEIYAAYRIMPGLQLHQLRVAAVAKVICDVCTCDIDVRSVVLACLFHDMANIIKSDLTVFPELHGTEGLAHWESVKKEYIEKYGENEHAATQAIAKEICLAPSVIALIEQIGFRKLEATARAHSFELKVVEYADLRVGPHGVLSLRARIEEARIRYVGRHRDMPEDRAHFDRLARAAEEIERQIFMASALTPEDITEQSIQGAIVELRTYPVA